jgi:UDP-N-acetylmuramate dehydrogenase
MLQIKEGKHLKSVSTFGIGGKARYWVDVFSLEEMQEAFVFSQKNQLRFFLLGNGSNCLFDDRGFNGLIIHNKIADCRVVDEEIVVGSGYSFSLLSKKAAEKKISGLEFAIGIPGTVGGAVFMNAGAHGFSISQWVERVKYLHYSGEVQEMAKEKTEFGYRSSVFQKMQGAIISITLKLPLSGGNSEEIIKKQKAFLDHRKKTQPYDEKSAGSVFRNPEHQSAGALIEGCGLKGM